MPSSLGARRERGDNVELPNRSHETEPNDRAYVNPADAYLVRWEGGIPNDKAKRRAMPHRERSP